MLSPRGSVTAIRLLPVKELYLATGTMRFVPRQAHHGGRTPTGIVIKRGLPLFTHSRRAYGLESASLIGRLGQAFSNCSPLQYVYALKAGASALTRPCHKQASTFR